MLNPGAAIHGERIALVYRAVGADGLSRLGLAWSTDGERIDQRSEVPFYETALDDPYGRLGAEDPRITPLDDRFYVTYCKVSVATADTPPLTWEPAPFRVRTGIGATDDFLQVREIGGILTDANSKDGVLFPERIGGRYAALIRVYPSIQYLMSPDLRHWSPPETVMEPVPGTWQGERIGAGPPPVRTPWGWLLFYHGNAHLRLPANIRRYAMGVAVLDATDPTHVLYRHPDPIFWPEAPYEVQGPVGNVVFGTGLVELGDRYFLYYGAGDGAIGVATASREVVFDFLRDVLGTP